MIIIFNCGSSSIKSTLFHSLDEVPAVKILAERINQNNAQITFYEWGDKHVVLLKQSTHQAAFQTIGRFLAEKQLLADITAVGHRVVHGGCYFTQSVLIDTTVIQKIETLTSLAPLHNPANLMGIHFAQKILPGIPQVASFDTAFHQTISEVVHRYPIPDQYYEQYAVRKYGFHGMSHQYVANKATTLLSVRKSNFIVAHLGNGCSITAIKNGLSIDTSMGFTPLDGLMMGTRSGSVDPGIFDYLQTQLGSDAKSITHMLNKQSGLLAICGHSDMREIEHLMTQGDTKAELAFNMFCHRVAGFIARYKMYFNALDALIFTGGIGENSTAVRAAIIKQLNTIGFVLDEAHNRHHGASNHHCIEKASKSERIMVIPTNEELMIATDTDNLIH